MHEHNRDVVVRCSVDSGRVSWADHIDVGYADYLESVYLVHHAYMNVRSRIRHVDGGVARMRKSAFGSSLSSKLILLRISVALIVRA